MPENTAVWLPTCKAPHFQVESAPYNPPGDNEIVIKNHAVAINPADWMIQEHGTTLMFQWLQYPCILGSDVAGEVVEVGNYVANFQVGDRVFGYAAGNDEKRNSNSESGFQTYTVLLAHMATLIPASMSYEKACVLPMGVATAACGLFQKDQLALQLPSMQPRPTGQTLLVWGGATSVGSNAIQLAVAAGYEVFTTASPKNFDFVKNLGASRVFDYHSKSVVSDIIAAFEGKTCAGALSIGAGAAGACLDIINQCKGNKFVSMATYPISSIPPKRLPLIRSAMTFILWNTSTMIRSKTRGIKWNFIFASTVVHDGVGEIIFNDFLGQALEEGKYLPAPEPIVVGNGLESIEKALEIHKKGVSAKKVVVMI
jgi:NADPH:quinone reductase-like Zn-dependent oxidoreductase